MIDDIFIKQNKYECQDCGETKRLQFGVCCVCGGEVVETEQNNSQKESDAE